MGEMSKRVERFEGNVWCGGIDRRRMKEEKGS